MQIEHSRNDQFQELNNFKEPNQQVVGTLETIVETIQHQQGMIYKFTEIKGKLIHSLCDGALLHHLGFSPEQIIGKELFDFLPKTEELAKLLSEDKNIQLLRSAPSAFFNFYGCKFLSFAKDKNLHPLQIWDKNLHPLPNNSKLQEFNKLQYEDSH